MRQLEADLIAFEEYKSRISANSQFLFGRSCHILKKREQQRFSADPWAYAKGRKPPVQSIEA
jgi:hypothetical protein